MNELELVAFEIISNVGMAKSLAIEAIREARDDNYEEAEKKIEEAKDFLVQGHHAHAGLISKEANGEKLAGKEVAISGFGNVAWGTAQKLNELGAKLVTISGPDGYIHDPNGISGEKVAYMLELRNSGKNVCAPYADKFPGSTFVAGKKPWEVKADLYIPCATQNEILIDDAKTIVAHGCKFVCEGSNMSSTNEAIKYLQDNGIIVGPSKAANAGGVACSCIEMGQNSGKTVFTPEQVYAQLENIMVGIHDSCANASQTYGFGYNLVAGANVAGFLKVADAMMAQGLV